MKITKRQSQRHTQRMTDKELEKNFILIMKPEELIRSEQGKFTVKPTIKTAENIFEQLFEEMLARKILEPETIRDIKFLFWEYLENLSNENLFDNYDTNITNNNTDEENDEIEFWQNPYQNGINLNITY